MSAVTHPYVPKRKLQEEEEDIRSDLEAVDDLQFASQYAIITQTAINNTSSSTLLYKIQTTADAEDENEEEDDDDESDVDLSQALQEMGDEDEDDLVVPTVHTTEINTSHRSKNPQSFVIPSVMTHHEVDLFTCPMMDLQKQLDFNLQVDASDLPPLWNTNTLDDKTTTTTTPSVVSSSTLLSAGIIQHHLVTDRTLVIESTCRKTVDSLLDVGTLLLMLIPETEKNTLEPNGRQFDTNLLNMTEIQYKDTIVLLIPLGKILEVFGPVGNPLYALRLDRPFITHEVIKHDTLKTTMMQDSPLTRHKEDITITVENESDAEKSKIDDTQEDNPFVHQPTAETIQGNDQQSAPVVQEPITTSPQLVETRSSASNPPTTVVDLWSEKGSLTHWLQCHPNTEVFYFRDQAKIVDTQLVAKNSRKGCDASNIFDEEVVNANEIDYSDDEAELEAKRSSRKGNDASKVDSNNSTTESIPPSRKNKARTNYAARTQHFHGHTPLPTSSTPIQYMQPQPAPYWNYMSMPPPPMPVQMQPSPNHPHPLAQPNFFPPPPLYGSYMHPHPSTMQPTQPTGMYPMYPTNYPFPPPTSTAPTYPHPQQSYWPGGMPPSVPYPPSMNNPPYASYSPASQPPSGFQTTNLQQYHATNTTAPSSSTSSTAPNASQGKQSGDTVYYHY